MPTVTLTGVVGLVLLNSEKIFKFISGTHDKMVGEPMHRRVCVHVHLSLTARRPARASVHRWRT